MRLPHSQSLSVMLALWVGRRHVGGTVNRAVKVNRAVQSRYYPSYSTDIMKVEKLKQTGGAGTLENLSEDPGTIIWSKCHRIIKVIHIAWGPADPAWPPPEPNITNHHITDCVWNQFLLTDCSNTTLTAEVSLCFAEQISLAVRFFLI